MRYLICIAVLLLAAPLKAEVVHADAHGFEVRNAVQLVVAAPNALAAFTRVANWWSKDHTYSGDPANLSLDLRPGGCFCERFPKGGGIEHLRVAYVDPGKQIILVGALGPLLSEAVNGVMDVSVTKIAGGSRLTLIYRASGFTNGGGDKFAFKVDAMLADQLKRFRAFAADRGGR
jgi:hypothetical protein